MLMVVVLGIVANTMGWKVHLQSAKWGVLPTIVLATLMGDQG